MTFCNGSIAGYLTYHVLSRDCVLSEQEMYGFIVRHIRDVTHTDRRNAGFILGQVARMHQRGKREAGQKSG